MVHFPAKFQQQFWIWDNVLKAVTMKIVSYYMTQYSLVEVLQSFGITPVPISVYGNCTLMEAAYSFEMYTSTRRFSSNSRNVAWISYFPVRDAYHIC
jgi:hypothetical protein